MVALGIAAVRGTCVVPGSRENPFSDGPICFEVFPAAACSGLAGDKVMFVLGRGIWLSAWCGLPWLIEFEHCISLLCYLAGVGKGIVKP